MRTAKGQEAQLSILAHYAILISTQKLVNIKGASAVLAFSNQDVKLLGNTLSPSLSIVASNHLI
ncbi:uncharacterized protein PHALS_14970 [Plasmopara halstedii]|uniref:Uncharacterized protein n=1 Tax=Plasmopara halstedii TaxID=4781 RepID=A0A0P1AYM3_PLAHL|nr:uncharacterized protein PHALS_14970 [Plasmopara halstedii]CEG47202.1 hypothetical protein PHALS_14970 [Plasmopara halstedii]|eukprot:XP_024583571.1 hypothetical protein PHALS_14970 [Plasmopara halstedii]